ncbi:MAG: hypothetical protein NT164_02760 [Verrucomicrobiae bacterium]|nr:hypothetical protein [Verrucomicrobiae bacterium]
MGYLFGATSRSRRSRSSAFSDKDPFSKDQLFETKRALHLRVTQLMELYKNEPALIYLHTSDGIDGLTKKLKSLLPEGRRSGPKEEFFWSLLRNESEQIRKDRDLLSSEKFEQIEAAKKTLL